MAPRDPLRPSGPGLGKVTAQTHPVFAGSPGAAPRFPMPSTSRAGRAGPGRDAIGGLSAARVLGKNQCLLKTAQDALV